MSTTTHISIAERLSQWCGRGWRAYARGERRMAAWLVSRGMPAAGAKVLLWTIKLGVMAALFYVSFWLVLPLVALLTIAKGAGNAGWSQQSTALTGKVEWRDGLDAFEGPGIYGGSGSTSYRID
jgi:hypothetical protein